MKNLKPTKPLRFLVVEDDLVAREYLQAFLSKFGECEAVKDGLEAILAFSECYEDECSLHYDLICIDINMPRISGLLCAQTIRGIEQEQNHSRQYSKIPILITSSVNEPSSVLKACKESGADHYFLKPLDLRKFSHMLIKLGLITPE